MFVIMSYKTNQRTGKPRNAMLTESHREFLRGGGSGLAKSTQSERRKAIKERVHNTILDFSLLFEEWPEEERKEVFDDTISGEFGQGLAHMLALTYLETHPYERFEHLLQRGVEEAERELKQSDQYRVRVQFEVESIGSAEFEKAIEKFDRGSLSSLTDEESHALITLLRHSETLTREDFDSMQDELLDQFEEFQDKLDEPTGTSVERDRSNDSESNGG